MKRLLVFMVLMLTSGAQADVYTWTDVRGTAHFTNKEYEIPARYKAKAKPLNIEAVQPGKVSTPQQVAPQQPQPQSQEKTIQTQATPSVRVTQPAVTAPGPQNPPVRPVPPRHRRRSHSEEE